jgi:hypothetical protein
MEPRALVERLIAGMTAYVSEHRGPPGPCGPLDIMSGRVAVIDPSRDPELRARGLAQVTPWIESLARLGFVDAARPLATGWIGFAPSQAFFDLATQDPGRVTRAILDALFPAAPVVPGRASLAVAALRDEVRGPVAAIDPVLLDVLLRELHDVCERDCRHATIALCGKLLELGLGALLVRWNVSFPEDATLGSLVDLVRGRAAPQQPDPHLRAVARGVLDLGLSGLADLVRTVRNGTIHARAFVPGGPAVALPSQEQAEGIVLITVDLLRRFVLEANAPRR